MNHSIFWKVIVRPLFCLFQDLLLVLRIEIIVFPRKFIGFISAYLTPAIFTIIFTWITATDIHIIIRLLILATEQNPASIEEDIYVKLSFALYFLNICSMNADNISNTFDLWAIFDPFRAKNAIENIKWLFSLVSQSVITLINDFQSNDVSITFFLVKWHSCINYNRIYVDRVLIIL